MADKCSKCHYKQMCRELPVDMSCEDIQKYAKAGEDPPKMDESEFAKDTNVLDKDESEDERNV